MREFYFVRHGETIHNVHNIFHDRTDVPLTTRGVAQATSLIDLFRDLPIKTICCSPLLRARQTKEIATVHLSCKEYLVPELGECDGSHWLELVELENNPTTVLSLDVQQFLVRVANGLQLALSYPGPVLIVAHGGVHWALCHHLKIQNSHWRIDNCAPVHFTLDPTGQWQRSLIPVQSPSLCLTR